MWGIAGSPENVQGGRSQPQTQETPLRSEWRFGTPALVTGLPDKRRAVAVSTAPAAGFPAGFSLLRAARWRLLLPGATVLLWLAGHFPSGRYITGAYIIAIDIPFSTLFDFNEL